MRKAPLLALASVFALAACGSSAQPPAPSSGDEPALGEMTNATGARHYQLPLDRYQLSHEEGLVIAGATQSLTVSCLRRFGFDPRSFAVPDEAKPTDRRYGINVEEEVSRFGYHPPPDQLSKKPDYRPPLAEHKVTLGQVNAHEGHDVPKGGCIGEARRALFGQDAEPSTGDSLGAASLDSDSGARYREDSRVREVYRLWSECMKKAGYDYADPWAANNDTKWSSSDQTTPAEIATGMADLKCRKEHRVVDVSLAVESAYQRRSIEQNSQRLDAERARNEAAVRRANEIVGR